MGRAGDWKSRVKIKPRSAPTSTRRISASTVQAASRPTSGAYYLLRVAPRGLRQPKDHPEHHRGQGHRAAAPKKGVGMLIEVVTKTHGPRLPRPDHHESRQGQRLVTAINVFWTPPGTILCGPPGPPRRPASANCRCAGRPR